MRFLVLGPLEVRVGAGVVYIPAGRQRALLGALALERKTPIAVEDLVDALWERPPRTAHASLLNHVRRLRSVLGGGAIETVPPGYRLRAQRRDVDLDQYLGLVERAGTCADAAQRGDLFREAEALWRGPVLAGVILFGRLGSVVDALNEHRLEALEARIDADLEAGRHLALVGELQRLVPEHPLRERMLAQLMLALYRSGRQADALEAFRRARRTLVSDLGLEPGEALVRLERAILAHELPLSPRTTRELRLPLLARVTELAPGTYEEKADFAYRLATALNVLGEHELAREAFDDACARAELAGSRAIAARAQLELDLYDLYMGGATRLEMIEVIERSIRDRDGLADDLGLSLALRMRGILRRELGSIADALTDFRAAATHSRRAVGTSWPTGVILTHEAEALCLGETPVLDAIERCHEILDAIPWGPPGPWGLYCALGSLHAMRGEFELARAFVARAAAVCDEYSLVGGTTWVSLWQAEVEELAGDVAAAEAVLREARTRMGAHPAPNAERPIAARHARMLALLRTDVATAAAPSPPARDEDPATANDRLRASALALAPTAPSRALRAMDEAVRVVEGTDLLARRAETLLDAASVRQAAGLDDGTTYLQEAKTLFERKGHLVGADRAERLT